MALLPYPRAFIAQSFIKPKIPIKSGMTLARIAEKRGMISMQTIVNIVDINWMMKNRVTGNHDQSRKIQYNLDLWTGCD